MSGDSVVACLKVVREGLVGVQREVEGSVLSPPEVFSVLGGVADLLHKAWYVVQAVEHQVSGTPAHFEVGLDGGGDPGARLARAVEHLRDVSDRMEEGQRLVNTARQEVSPVHVTYDWRGSADEDHTDEDDVSDGASW